MEPGVRGTRSRRCKTFATAQSGCDRLSNRFLREAGLFHEQPDTAEQNEPTHNPTEHLGIESRITLSPSQEPTTMSGKSMAINAMLERS